MTLPIPQLVSGELEADHYQIPVELFERVRTKHSGVVGVCRLGALTSPRLFYIHGFNYFSRASSPLLLRLAASFRVLTCDLPGNGWTDPPKDGKYTPETFLTCIHEVLLHEGWVSDAPVRPGMLPPRGYHLCGHSQGGMLSILAAEDRRFHRDILSVTAICPAGISMSYLKEGRSRVPRLYMSFIRLLCRLLPQKHLAGLVRKNVYPEFDELPSELRKYFIETFDSYLEGTLAPTGPENCAVPGGPAGKLLYRTFYMLQYFPWDRCQAAYKAFCEDQELAGRKRVILAGRDTTCPADDVLREIRAHCPDVATMTSSALRDSKDPRGPQAGGAGENVEVIYYPEDNHEVPTYNAGKVSADVELGRVQVSRRKPSSRPAGLPGAGDAAQRLETLEAVSTSTSDSDSTSQSGSEGDMPPPGELAVLPSAPDHGSTEPPGETEAEGEPQRDFSDLEEGY